MPNAGPQELMRGFYKYISGFLQARSTPMEPARIGREKQRYDGDTRLVAGCLPVTADGQLVLIRSAKRKDWILPKGGWELDETAAEAAVRETYEEAGVRGTVTSDLGLHEIVSSRGNKSRAAMFLMLVTEMLDEWPENHRSRTLVSFDEALECCVRQEVVSVLHAYKATVATRPASTSSVPDEQASAVEDTVEDAIEDTIEDTHSDPETPASGCAV